MTDTVEIGGVSIDIDDPCAVLSALRKAQLVVATGGSVSMTRFGEDEVRFGAANLPALRKLIADYSTQCARKTGKRTRFAANVIWRP